MFYRKEIGNFSLQIVIFLVHNNLTMKQLQYYIAGMAKLRPPNIFLRPLQRTVDVDFGHNFVGKHLNLACFRLKISNNFLRNFFAALFLIWSASKQTSLATPAISYY
jgi:hypothetical protein